MTIIPIYVIGAGPWDPELLTLKAIKVLRRADVVYYSSLVNENIINTYAPRAMRINMGHVRSDEHRKFINQAIEYAKRGLVVVFVKNGDPVVFGRGIEICREAAKSSIPCEIIPGVSSFTAAAARYLIDLNGVIALMAYPNISSSIEADVKVIFMGTKSIRELLGGLRDEEEMIIVSRVTYPDEKATVVRRGEDINIDVKQPSLIFIRRRGGGDEDNKHGA